MKRLASVQWWWLAILVIGLAACSGGDEAADDPPADEVAGTMPATQAAAASRTSEAPPTGTTARTSATALREVQPTSTSGASRTSTSPTDHQDTPTVTSTSMPMTPTSTPSPTASPSPTLESIPTATELVEPTPDFPDLGDSEATEEPGDERQTTVIVLGGSGSAMTEPVWLEAGLVVLRLYHDGPAGAEFRVVSTQTGAEVDRVAVPAGAQVAGSVFAVDAAGEYAIDVTGDGEWTINLVQPIAAQSSVEGLPWEWADTGPQAFYFVELPGGSHTITMTHAGGAAVVELLPVSGAPLVLQIEAGNGPLAVEVPSGGAFAVAVTASDSWSLTIE